MGLVGQLRQGDQPAAIGAGAGVGIIVQAGDVAVGDQEEGRAGVVGAGDGRLQLVELAAAAGAKLEAARRKADPNGVFASDMARRLELL